jgi:peptide deformylase
MKKVKIITLPNPILRMESKRVGNIDKKTYEVIEKMTMALEYSEIDGLGIAAPQIGENTRIILIRVKEQRDKEGNIIQKAIPLTAYINPRITKFSREQVSIEEGCLSCPGLFAEVIRPKKVRFETTEVDGKTKKINASGLFARVLQHEIDHLDGIIFLDHVKDKTKIRKVDAIEREKGNAKRREERSKKL